MALYELDGISPDLPGDDNFWVAPSAAVMGRVAIGHGVSVWFGTVIRGDNEPITIGDRCNVQENCVFHTDPGYPMVLGDGVTVGHRAILHGCTIGRNALIGMGAIVLNGATIGENCLIGAGALITEGKVIPDNSLVVGTPGRIVRELDADSAKNLTLTADHYVANGRRFAGGLKLLVEKG